MIWPLNLICLIQSSLASAGLVSKSGEDKKVQAARVEDCCECQPSLLLYLIHLILQATMTTQASFTPSWNTLLVSLASLLLARVAYSLFFHPLANYPGPLVARLGLFPWAFIRIIKADSASALIRVHKKYGKWVRIGYNELSTCDSDAVNILYTAGSKVGRLFLLCIS